MEHDLPVYVKESNIPNAGFGLFARRNLVDNDIITEYGGQMYSAKEAKQVENRDYFFEFPRVLVDIALKSISDEKQKDKLKTAMQNWEGTILDNRVNFRVSEMGRWINNGKKNTTNVIFEFAGSKDQGKTWIMEFVAMRDIKKGEELLWDYGDNYWHKNALPTQRCVNCKINQAKWAELSKSRQIFCSHSCHKFYYGIEARLHYI